jgi:integrase
MRSRFKVPDSRTEAGIRKVEMSLYLRDELVAYVGDPDRFRDRILGRALKRANANRAQAGLPELPQITPHSLRRTWATFAAVGRDPKCIAAQIGHTDPALTFSVYQQVATWRYIDEQAIWTVMRFADEPAERDPSPGRRSARPVRGSRRALLTVPREPQRPGQGLGTTENDRIV